MSRPRYAVYLTPSPDTPLWRAASHVIGRDAVTGEMSPFPVTAPFTAPDWAALTAEPRRYGFHATLKAPFELAEDTDEDLLRAAARGFAETRSGFAVADLEVAVMKAFIALVPVAPHPDLLGLAADCVVAFEPFRAPLGVLDRSRRIAELIEPRHIESLDRWGYPYVFEDFRFHMTLTGRLPEERRAEIRAGLADFLEGVARPLAVDAITLFRQESRDAPFRMLERFPFAA